MFSSVIKNDNAAEKPTEIGRLALFEMRFLGFGQLFNKSFIKLGFFVAVAVDKHILIDFLIVHAPFLHKSVAFKQGFGDGRYPHKRLRIA